MKKISFLIALIAIVVSFFSCSDEPSLINKSLIRDQLANLSVPSAEEIQEKLSTSGAQKVRAEEFVSQRVLALDKEYFNITETSATRYLQYYEIASWGELKRSVQIEQRFQIKDGVLDTSDWGGAFDLESISMRRCHLWFSEHISSTTVFFRSDDGLQLAYQANLYDGVLYLPALANGTWQVQVGTFNKGMFQTFITIPTRIKKSDPENVLLLYDDIFSLSNAKENTVAIATVSAHLLIDNWNFVCEDENGNLFSQPIPIAVGSESISFAIPFKPRYIYLWGNRGKQIEISPSIEKGSDGLYHYELTNMNSPI